MALIVGYLPPGAIATYSDLVAAVRDQMDNDLYDSAKINRAIRFAEAHFTRELRTPDMETEIVLSVSTEVSPLPTDCLGVRAIYVSGARDRLLTSMSPSGLIATYAGLAGSPAAYAIEGANIRIAPVGTVSLDMVYYARPASLSADSASNWLLTKYPDLYLWGTCFYLYQRERDPQGSSEAMSLVSSILTSIHDETSRNRWGAGPLRPKGVVQVRSARA